MPKKITTLTKEQKAMMSKWRDKWIEIGLRTGDADWSTFNKYMPICYEKANLQYPKNTVKVSSPIVGGLAASIADAIWKTQGDGDAAVGVAVRDAVGGAVGVTVGDAVDGAVRAAVDATVGAAVDGAVGDVVDVTVGDAVDGAVRGAVDGAVDGAVGVAVRDAGGVAVGVAVDGAVDGAVGGAVDDAVRGAVDDAKLNWHYWLGGQFWVGGWWGGPSSVSFFTDVCNLELNKDIKERAEAYRKVCESVNYIWCNKNFIMVCERPKHIKRDDKGRLHSLDGKAIEYPDGWGLYMINGVQFKEKQFKDFTQGKLDALDIMTEKNQDRKRVMIMNYGNEKLIKELKAKLLNEEKDQQDNLMRLWSIKRKEDEPMIFYEGVDPSKDEKIYLRVPPTITTAYEAKLWTFKPLWELYQDKGKFELLKET